METDIVQLKKAKSAVWVLPVLLAVVNIIIIPTTLSLYSIIWPLARTFGIKISLLSTIIPILIIFLLLTTYYVIEEYRGARIIGRIKNAPLLAKLLFLTLLTQSIVYLSYPLLNYINSKGNKELVIITALSLVSFFVIGIYTAFLKNELGVIYRKISITYILAGIVSAISLTLSHKLSQEKLKFSQLPVEERFVARYSHQNDMLTFIILLSSFSIIFLVVIILNLKYRYNLYNDSLKELEPQGNNAINNETSPDIENKLEHLPLS